MIEKKVHLSLLKGQLQPRNCATDMAVISYITIQKVFRESHVLKYSCIPSTTLFLVSLTLTLKQTSKL